MKRPEKHLQFIVNEIFKRHVGAVRTKTRGMGEDYRTALTDETIDVCEGVWGKGKTDKSNRQLHR